MGIDSSAKYHFFHLNQIKRERTLLLAIFLFRSCPKRERYYICRLKLLRIGEIASRLNVGIRASRLHVGKAALEFEC